MLVTIEKNHCIVYVFQIGLSNVICFLQSERVYIDVFELVELGLGKQNIYLDPGGRGGVGWWGVMGEKMMNF